MKKILIILIVLVLAAAAYFGYQQYRMVKTANFNSTEITTPQKEEVLESFGQISEPISINDKQEALADFLSN